MAWINRSIVMALALAWAAFVGAADRVNINTADAPTIASVLSGVGLKKAEAIVHYRETNGRFNAPEELVKVKGIGPATVEKNAGKIIVSESDAADESADKAASGAEADTGAEAGAAEAGE